MKNIKKLIGLLAMIASSMGSMAGIEEYRTGFICPSDENRSIIIWQWMDGLVSKESITKDLEAFKAAGLSGVQNFQIGGNEQIRVGNPENAIGSEQWKEMMRWAIIECKRLGLTFGTHNCPGWSSSAYGNVTPEYSMQKLVYSDTILTPGQFKRLKKGEIELAKPDIDKHYNYYEDIAVLAFPNDSIVAKSSIINLNEYFDGKYLSRLKNIESNREMVIMRIGHTANGKTNAAQAPLSGQGFECDKMRREAVKHFWDGYPRMLVEIAGEMAGTVFDCIEIDSYEAGGQNWSVVLPEEFKKRKGYDILPYLPYMTGRAMVDSQEESGKFMKDLVDVATALFAENYYGYMHELVSEIPGMKLMIEPYGTGRQQPFQVLDINKILDNTPDALIATEFWVKPETWGWKDMKRHEKVIRERERKMLYAEGFTCWPLHAWKDSPETLKPICDRAYCSGVNRMMLHAGAVNPWINVEPGMSFGIWGTQFVPTQTWWKAGGAKALFEYMARCQSLLQRGVPAKNQGTVTSDFQTYHRVDGENEIIFLCNPTDDFVSSDIDLTTLARNKHVELWDAYSLDMSRIENNNINLTIEPNGSRFIIISSSMMPNGLDLERQNNKLLTKFENKDDEAIDLTGGWSLRFPDVKDGVYCEIDSLEDWIYMAESDMKYFSGTATYRNQFDISHILEKDKKVILDLGNVKNMASVRINGFEFPVMWKSPYLLDITDGLKRGKNEIEIDVTNLWVNRMVGDEKEPDDITWSDPLQYTFAPGSPVAGRYMAEIPAWLSDGTERPSKRRKTVVGFKFFTSDSPLMPSGLLGPVRLRIAR